MTSILVGFAMALLASSAFAQAEEREFVARGEILAVSVEDGTLTMKEIAEPPEGSRPGTMQSGVVRQFTVTADTKLTGAQARPIELADVRPGDRVTIHYVLDAGKNVARSLSVTSPATE